MEGRVTKVTIPALLLPIGSPTSYGDNSAIHWLSKLWPSAHTYVIEREDSLRNKASF
uniref:Uncharacterized protein n=1 Tax=Picea glauca TaxID=3330 RepID=A0A101M197_PICGL|nr:hypothetical protein ABT39_MTgene3745 [Picea glauca]QHR87498.1 hypothetical protein Q903MT_gene1509 [Picea sitchensis]